MPAAGIGASATAPDADELTIDAIVTMGPNGLA